MLVKHKPVQKSKKNSQILRTVYEPVHNVDSGIFERKINNELQKLFNKLNICQFLKSKILEWAGNVGRTERFLINKILV